jgi:murein DD-endopeptidase MepM/ murein hydrolase activator NlpD
MERKKLLRYILIGLGVALIIWWAVSLWTVVPKSVPNKVADSLLKAECRYEYGIPVDSFEVEDYCIRSGEQLSSIFSSHLPDSTFRIVMANLLNSTFDVRRLKAGQSCKLFFTDDTTHSLAYFVYHESAANAIIFSFRDSFKITEYQKPLKTVHREISGVISTSLWNTMSVLGASPAIAIDLSEIFAWEIDFFGLQKGDNFKFIYDEMMVDSTSMGIDKVYGAYFQHAGKDYYAVPFVQNDVLGYYDLQGNSLKKAFLKAPLKFSRISSRFSHSRLHPILKIRRPHLGVDYAAPKGTPVHTIGNGRIIKMGYAGGAGKMITVKHNGTYTTTYMHLSNFARGLHNGSSVAQGQLIGYVGSTGLSSGSHLDFRFYKNGKPIDPLKVESPSGEPIKAENKVAFDSIKTDLYQRITKIN